MKRKGSKVRLGSNLLKIGLNRWKRVLEIFVKGAIEMITCRPKCIEYLEIHFISFCETTERYPTLLLTIVYLVLTQSSLQLIVAYLLEVD